LEFLGRLDHQVKVRGHRIELGEIEAALRACPGVSRGIVIVVEDASSRRLAGFVVGAGVDGGRLRAFLAERLPGYMVPEHVAVIDEVPVTANGKVDRVALGAMVAGERVSTMGQVPQGDIENSVAGIWSQLLDTPHIHRDDNFFALGGDSLLATRLVSAVLQQLHVELSMREIFIMPTVANLADTIATRQKEFSTDDFEEGLV
jgi:acyl carrier protein